jgi:hypothetical protein
MNNSTSTDTTISSAKMLGNKRKPNGKDFLKSFKNLIKKIFFRPFVTNFKLTIDILSIIAITIHVNAST